MNDLVIHMKKKADGSAALSCRRADGSVTWQRQDGQQGRFFPRHDLTHYAVETILGHLRGFYGLVAEGWDLTDFGQPWPKGPLPVEALASELIVGFLDRERAAGVEWSASDFNASAETFCAQRGRRRHGRRAAAHPRQAARALCRVGRAAGGRDPRGALHAALIAPGSAVASLLL